MKKYAWTMAELLIAMTIIIILTAVGLSTLKPKTQNSKAFIYATMRNITRGNAWILEHNALDTLDGTRADGNDWYCAALADALTTKSVNCTSTTDLESTTVNMTFENGVTIKGLATPWQAFTGTDYQFKNILVDIDGARGVNKIWIDQFPLRIFRYGDREGIVIPSNCGAANDYTYKQDGTKVSIASVNRYCGSKTARFVADNSIISYDSVRIADASQDDDNATGIIVSIAQSHIASDCGSYGGDGFYTKAECAAGGYKLYEKCATKDTCKNCSGVCPNGSSDEAGCLAIRDTNNPGNLECNMYPHKPNIGMSLFLEGMNGDLDTDY
ncbi:MAG: type II secretion system protein [Candidatus Gastranaerophilales bacterium]|nr:type II secretion system protein [Candidatus Gastranaerophilales bacterium]